MVEQTLVVADAQIAGRGRQATMTEQQLDGGHIRALLEQVDGEAVSHCVRGNGFGHPTPLECLFAGVLHRPAGDVPFWNPARKQPKLGAFLSPPLRRISSNLGEHDVASFSPLALLDANHHSLTINVGSFQSEGFGNA